MSCVHVTPEMEWLLTALRSYPVPHHVLEGLQATPEWSEALAWGWIMETGELTGRGAGMRGRLDPKGLSHLNCDQWAR